MKSVALWVLDLAVEDSAGERSREIKDTHHKRSRTPTKEIKEAERSRTPTKEIKEAEIKDTHHFRAELIQEIKDTRN